MGENYKAKFKERFRILYEEAGSSKQMLADKCEISHQSVTYYLSGERMPKSFELVKICDACKVSADWLLGLSNIRSLSADLRSAVMYTGLTEDMIERIRVSYNRKQVEALTDLVEDKMFPHLLDDYNLFLSFMDRVKTYEEYDKTDDFEISENNKVVMSFSTAKSLLSSRVSNDLAEICSHKEQELLLSLFIDGTEEESDEF